MMTGQVRINAQVNEMIIKNFLGSAVACGRASNSKSRGPGFDPHKCHRVMCDTLTPYSTG